MGKRDREKTSCGGAVALHELKSQNIAAAVEELEALIGEVQE